MRKMRSIDRRSTLRGLFALAAIGVAPDASNARQPEAKPYAHPFVFADRASLTQFLECDSLSTVAARRILEGRCNTHLQNVASHTLPFAGCNLAMYYRGLTNEQGGAAEAASTFATYSYLTDISHGRYGQRKLADDALKAAREILLSWARSGIRDSDLFRSGVDQFCDDQGVNSLDTRFAIGLTFGRGTPALVNAVDLLLALGAFTGSEAKEIDQFLAALGALILDASNFRAWESNLDCNRFNNHVSVQTTALVSITRLRHDQQGLAAVAFGQGGRLAISWIQQVARAIYGPGQEGLNCYKSGESPNYSQTSTPQAGEIVDRYRARTEQTFGYPMFSLTHLLLTLKVLSRTQFKEIAPVTEARARITLSLEYYGAYFVRYLAADEAKIPAGFAYPGSDQYVGKLLSRKDGATISGRDGHLLPYLLARPLLPRNDMIEAVISRATQFAPHRPFSAVNSLYVSDICGATL